MEYISLFAWVVGQLMQVFALLVFVAGVLTAASLLLATTKAGILFKSGGVWVGAHYSKYNRRWCINLIPCVTIWICREGGKVPDKAIR